MTRIKFATINTPTFREAGLALTEGWSEIDLDAATPEQLDMLESQLGNIVQVHEHDREAYEVATGLKIVNGRFVAENLGDRHQAKTSVVRARAALERARKDVTEAVAKADAAAAALAALEGTSKPEPATPEPPPVTTTPKKTK